MHSLFALSALISAFAASVASKALPVPPQVDAADTTNVVAGTFQQLLDHDNPSLGTFSQRYWYNAQWYRGSGAPAVLFTPGEIAADGYMGYLQNETITGLFAEQNEGIVFLLEHRYWGGSSPYPVLSTENMRYLTLDNAIADLNYFARNVDVPMFKNGTGNAPKAPWVLSGGSYSGALTAWTQSLAPGTFWAYHSSSAPVEAINDYWQYFSPIQEGMAKNCSRDVNLVMEHIDYVTNYGSAKQQQALKDMFGLGDIEHMDDVAAALENGPELWQENSFYTGYSGFFQFCDYVENIYASPGSQPGPNGVGLQKALSGYASWFKEVFFPGFCAGYGYWTDANSTACFNTYNTSNPLFTDMSVDNTYNRQWNWMLCNEPFLWWQDGAPSGQPTLTARSLKPSYWDRQCGLFFPTASDGFTYGVAKGKTAAALNRRTKGWLFTDTTRLTWTTGQYDPWRTSGMGSEYRPGGPYQGTPSAPLNQIPGGFHCSDLRLQNAETNAGVAQVVDTEAAQIKQWVNEFYQK